MLMKQTLATWTNALLIDMEDIVELLVTCLECGQQWQHNVPNALGAFLSIFIKSRPPIDQCPACGGRRAIFRRREGGVSTHSVER